MRVLPFLVGLFSLASSSLFPKPTPRLELLDPAPLDSAFSYQLIDKELEEIDSICGWLKRSMLVESEYTHSPNGRYKMKSRMLPGYEEDDIHTEAEYFDEKGTRIWIDTLEKILPHFRPIGLTNDGKYLIKGDNFGGGVTFYEVSPLPKYLGTSDRFDYGWELLEQENLVFCLSGTTTALYKQDGKLLWEKPPIPERRELYDPKFSISKDEKVILVGCYDRSVKEAWLALLSLKGEELSRVRFSTEFSFTGYLRFIYVSASEPRLAIAVSDAALACFDMDSKKKLWDYRYPNPNFWSGSVGFFPDGKTIAAVISHWDPKKEKPHIQLFDSKTGILQGNYVNLDDSMKLWRETSKIEFTKDGKYLIAVTPKRKYLFRVNYED